MERIRPWSNSGVTPAACGVLLAATFACQAPAAPPTATPVTCPTAATKPLPVATAAVAPLAPADPVPAVSVERDPRNARYACNWAGENLEPHATYHVSPSGADTSNGTSPGHAFATLQHAANVTKPGDTVLVYSGNYSGEKGGEAVLHIHTSGTERAPITFKAAPGEHPVIKNNTWSAVKVADASYVVIEGLELWGQNEAITREFALAHKTDKTNSDTNSQGVEIWNYKTGGHSHHVIVRNNRIHHFGGNAIGGSECDCITIADNTLYSSGFYSVWLGYGVSIWQPHTLVQSPGYKLVVRGNRIFDIWNYVPYVDLADVTEPLAGGALMLDLFTKHGYAGPTLVEGNVIFRNQGCGIQNYETINVDVVNNTLYENLLDAGVDWGEYCDFRSHGSRVFNNVFVARKGYRPTFLRSTIPDATFGHNVYWPNRAPVARMGADDVYGDPRFLSVKGTVVNGRVSDSGWDFHLGDGSLAIDRGDPKSAPSLDADGKPRPIGKGVDCGAYER